MLKKIRSFIEVLRELENSNLLKYKDIGLGLNYTEVKITDTKNCSDENGDGRGVKYAKEYFEDTLERVILYNTKDHVLGLFVTAKVLDSNTKISFDLDNYLCLDITILNQYREETTNNNILLIPKDISIIVSNHRVDNGFLVKYEDIDGVTYEENCNLSIVYNSPVYKCTNETLEAHFKESNNIDEILYLRSWSSPGIYDPYQGFNILTK